MPTAIDHHALLRPVLHLLKMQFDGAIYLTDGWAPEPVIRPPCKLIWVITPDGQTGEHLKYGRAIQLPA